MMDNLSKPIYDELKKVKILCIDLDGVVIQGNELIAGSKEAIDEFIELGYQIIFLTNNSGSSSEKIEQKLKKLGLSCADGKVTNAISSVIYLLDKLDPSHTKTILPLGTDDLLSEIEKYNHKVVLKPPSDYLVVGFDKNFNYESICMAIDSLHSGAEFIACNREANFPDGNGLIRPGCGALVAAIEAASQTGPKYIAGKPETNLLQMVLTKYNYLPYELLIVGDTLESDIEMANRFHSPSVFIRRGRDYSDAGIKPTLVVNYLFDLVEYLEAAQNSII